MSEQRRATRTPPRQTITVINVMTGDPMGHVGNFSGDGMLLVSEHPVAESALFQCTFRLGAAADDTLRVGIREQWSEPANVRGQYWIGFHFIDISQADQQRLDRWLEQNLE
ncbi:MAG: PilZ domain-containing protein [Dokdonella sp.]